jgi:glycosyltransferase involved in cell wall biosynthesis
MADKRPLVSIGLPVYNGEQFLRNTLDSLLAQTYENFELIISDNASTDGTREICLEYTRRDRRVKYYQNDANYGGATNMNRVFALSSGDYFMWASDEDYWAPAYANSCMEVLLNSDRIVLAGTWGTFIDAETEEVLFTDKGFSTVGLSASEGFKLHKLTIHSGSYVAAIFHGIYKRRPLSSVMPVWN